MVICYFYQQRNANINTFSLRWHPNDFFSQRIADTECFSVRVVLRIGGSPSGSVSIAWLSAQVSLWQLGWLILWAEPGRGTASRWAVPVHPARAQGHRQGPGSLRVGHSWHVPPLPISISFISCYVRASTSANSCILTISNPPLSWGRQTHSSSNRYNRSSVSQGCCFVSDHAGFKSLSFFVFSLCFFLKHVSTSYPSIMSCHSGGWLLPEVQTCQYACLRQTPVSLWCSGQNKCLSIPLLIGIHHCLGCWIPFGSRFGVWRFLCVWT